MVKDYDCDIQYHPGKANSVADALSRKGEGTLMTIQSYAPELQKEMTDLELEVITGSLMKLTIQPDILVDIKEGQVKDPEMVKEMETVKAGIKSAFTLSEDGLLFFKGRLCVPNSGEVKKQILTEAHNTPYSIHPGSTKMYQDLKRNFWWNGMKREVVEFVSKCLACQMVKAEHQRPGGELQTIQLPEWKW